MNGMHTTRVEKGIRDSQQIKKRTLNFEGMFIDTSSVQGMCEIGHDMLILVLTSMITSFAVGYAFDIIEFWA